MKQPIHPEYNSIINKNKPNWVQILTLVIVFVLTVFVIVVSSIILSKLSGENKAILNYEEIKHALSNGDKLRIVMDYNYVEMYVNDEYYGPADEYSGFDVADWQYFSRGVIGNDKAYVIFSFSSLIFHPYFKSIYDYGKVRLYETGNFDILVYFLSADKFEVLEYKVLNSTIAGGALKFYHQTPRFIKLF